MRLVLVLCLIGLVVLCPSICGAADAGDHARHEQPASSHHDDSPVHCPDEGASCVCGGAVRPSDLRPDHLDPAGLLPPALLDLAYAPRLSSGDSALTALRAVAPAQPGPRTARAWLQNYRF